MGDPRWNPGSDAGGGDWGPPFLLGVPHDFIPVRESLSTDLARRLGYVGEARFVAFCYESRVEEVLWEDGSTYGFGAGGWCVFLDRIEPIAKQYGAILGVDRPAADVLLFDRQSGSAYFAERESAKRFLSGRTQNPGERG